MGPKKLNWIEAAPTLQQSILQASLMKNEMNKTIKINYFVKYIIQIIWKCPHSMMIKCPIRT